MILSTHAAYILTEQSVRRHLVQNAGAPPILTTYARCASAASQMTAAADEVPKVRPRRRCLLEARQVRKYFPIHAGLFGTTTAAVKAVDGIDFVVREGETFGLVGESGCGKSTTSRLLLRLEAPTSGEIFFDGKEIASLAGTELQTYRRALQAVFQDPTTSLSPRMPLGASASRHRQRCSAAARSAGARHALNEVDCRLTPPALSPSSSAGQRSASPSRGRSYRLHAALHLDEPVSALDIPSVRRF